MFVIGLCDDDDFARHSISSYFKSKNINGNRLLFRHYKNGRELLEELSDGVWLDLLFLNITSQSADGIKTGQQIRSCPEFDSLPFIYMSDGDNHSKELLTLWNFMLVPKPLELGALAIHISRILHSSQRHPQSHVFVYRFNGEKKCISIDNIVYLKSNNRILEIYVPSNNKVALYDTFYGKLDNVEPHFPRNIFVRCNRSYLVNLEYSTHYMDNKLVLLHNEQIPVSRSKRQLAKNIYFKYRVNSLK